MVILVCILINAASSAMEHFDGSAVQVDVLEPASANCCDANCDLRSAERCPRGLVRMQGVWYDFIFIIELIFNVVFSVEVVVKILSWWSFTKYLRYPVSVDVY